MTDEIKIDLTGMDKDQIKITDTGSGQQTLGSDSTEIPPMMGGEVVSWGEIPPTNDQTETTEEPPAEEFDVAEVIELLNGNGLLDDVLSQGINALGDYVTAALKKAQHQGVDPETVRRYKVVDSFIKVIHYYAKTAPIGHPLSAFGLSIMMVSIAYMTSPIKTPPPEEKKKLPESDREPPEITKLSDEEIADEITFGGDDWGVEDQIKNI